MKKLIINLLCAVAVCLGAYSNASAGVFASAKFGATIGADHPKGILVIREIQEYNKRCELHDYVGASWIAAIIYDDLQHKGGWQKTEYYGDLLLSFGETWQEAGLNDVALLGFDEARKFWLDKKGKSSEKYIRAVCNIADLYMANCDYVSANEQITAAREAINGQKKFKEYTLMLDVLDATMCAAYGDYNQAIDRLYQAKADGYKGKITSLLETYLNLAGRRDEAIALLRKDTDKIDEIQTVEQCNQLLRLAGFLSRDKSTASEAVAIGDSVLTFIMKQGYVFSIASTRRLQAVWLYRAGRKAESIEMGKRALRSYEELDDVNFAASEYNSLLKDLAYILAFEQNEPEQAATYALKEVNRTFKNITYNMFVDETMREQRWKEMSPWYTEQFPSIAAMWPTTEMLTTAYNCLLVGKGMLLNTEQSIKDVVKNSGNRDLQILYAQMKSDEAKLRGPLTFREDSLYKQEYQSLSLRFSKACSENPQLKLYLNYTWEDVKKALKSDERAIEFFIATDGKQAQSYYALVLANDSEAPKLVKICDADALKSISKEDASALYQAVWQALESEIRGAKRVYFAADGDLHQMPVEVALSETSGIEAVRLSSTREVIRRLASTTLPRRADFFGGMKYGADVAQTDNVRAGVNDLPGTEQEALACAQLLSEASISPRKHMGESGTEEAFKELSGTMSKLIHVATHSMYISDDLQEEITASEPGDTLSADILDRTALLFSGANRTIKGATHKKDDNDGILTASEIAHLNLSNTDFVILSACETGLGDTSGGGASALRSEGVFGLQRGFKKAGVQTIMMSLWKVDDDATKMFMEKFYQAWIADPEHSKIAALGAAQRAVRSYRGTINGTYRDFSSPQYWAAFILLDAI